MAEPQVGAPADPPHTASGRIVPTADVWPDDTARPNHRR